MNSCAWLYWNPPKEAFSIPFLDLSIAWYGILFALGFVLGYFVLIPILKGRNLSPQLADRLAWSIIIGTLVGSRLGHVFFYDWPYYQAHPLEILMIRKGGLASHGGTIGVLVALFLFLRWNRRQFPSLSFISLLDILVVPTALTATCIRLGNFLNQEILGYATTLPWAIVFGDPADGSSPIPRHPAQLYEALIYFAIFILLFTLWKKYKTALKEGTLSGLFFILVFGSRFFIEFLKLPQSTVIDETSLQMGQYLSLPFVCFGLILLFHKQKRKLLQKF